MKIEHGDLKAAARGIIAEDQADALWKALTERAPAEVRFDLAHVAYYFGALIVIGAMGWFVNRAWDLVDGFALSLIALAYAAAFVAAGRTLWDKNNLRVPGGLMYTMAVCMTPLFVYGIERQTGWWLAGDPGSYRGYYDWVKGSWFPMEVGTIIAGLVALRIRRFPFLTFPIAFALWFLSMDVTPLLVGYEPHGNERDMMSAFDGLDFLMLAYAVDLKSESAEDFAFWGYLFGMLAFWGGLTAMDSNSELGKFLYCLINVGLVAVSVVLRRRVFLVFGALGISMYLGHLSYTVFRDSLLFPLALSVIGILVIWLGVTYQRNAARVEEFVQTRLPERVRNWVPPRARRPITP